MMMVGSQSRKGPPINKLKSGKAAFPGEIPTKALKAEAALALIADISHPLFAKIWSKEKFPEVWKEGHELDDLHYTDDLALLSNTQQRMQTKTDLLENSSKSIGLPIHAANQDGINRIRTGSSLLNGKSLELECFCYFESIMDRRGGIKAIK
ncbi:hypothetical protein ElyMa_003921700 [Elysia marginata]|uniref:Reverse transcriptase domain-containing protein n=1 Tax=Elysia marginata TaxID=1093978 RepID=A0AAV4FRW3_9GAST|nr:hypothetical protein ElyMa_003921700 [Elysia marginata]